MNSEALIALFKWLQNWLRHSPRFHLVQGEPETLRELVDLFDRFVNGDIHYGFEWDDFISWEKSNKNIEEIRDRIGEFEPLLASSSMADRNRYVEILVEERNRAAALIGIPPRDPPNLLDEETSAPQNDTPPGDQPSPLDEETSAPVIDTPPNEPLDPLDAGTNTPLPSFLLKKRQ